MPLSPPTIPTWRAGVVEHADPVAGQPSVVGFDSGIRDTLAFLSARIVFRARQTTAQSVANGTWTALNFAAAGIDEDPYSGWNSSNPNQWSATWPGVYLAFGTVWFSGTTAASTVGLAAVGFDEFVTGVGLFYSGNEMPAPTDNTAWAIPVAEPLYLSVGDYLTLMAYQGTGGALNTSVAAGQQSQVDVYWLSG